MLGNKEIMAKNIQFYMQKSGKTATEICNDLGFRQSTFSNWVNGKIYPRIDKIEMLADYFGVSKAALVEMPGSDFPITDEEINLIIEYRKSDATTQEAIKRLLRYNRGITNGIN